LTSSGRIRSATALDGVENLAGISEHQVTDLGQKLSSSLYSDIMCKFALSVKNFIKRDQIKST